MRLATASKESILLLSEEYKNFFQIKAIPEARPYWSEMNMEWHIKWPIFHGLWRLLFIKLFHSLVYFNFSQKRAYISNSHRDSWTPNFSYSPSSNVPSPRHLETWSQGVSGAHRQLKMLGTFGSEDINVKYIWPLSRRVGAKHAKWGKFYMWGWQQPLKSQYCCYLEQYKNLS